MNKEHIESKVLAALSAVLKSPLPVGLQTSMENTAEWDSLKHIEIVFALEEELDLQFTEEEMSELRSASLIVAAALAKQHAA